MIETTSTRADTRSRIVEVAAQLLREQGPSAVTTRGVAEAAGVQAPTIYRLFGDKDGLLEAVAEHTMAGFVSAKAAVVAAASADDVDPLDDLRSGWLSQIEFGVANPTLFALMSDPARVIHSPAARSGREVLEARVHRIALAGRLRVSEPRAVKLIQSAGTGVIQTQLSTPPSERDAGLADDMFEAVLARILTDAPEREANTDTVTAATIAFRAVATKLDALTEAERMLLTDWLDRALELEQTRQRKNL
ncbi:TetR/AcrR family transcriptional regulator [Subtercola endophyticus]|uniref:TetR/AcrR family transcriptional regulator n=1 Tax=Subtercola endophyticus TaxID=2895559 RepID=UPI001E3C54B6|nr:TetR/AcrR family transcriptional regulator [Subtercola endophyticus]UFS60572.1 TetR/AcrR family transcriptional regulator [Subtercola endophyticus]